jgi:GH35 family endo-1,4-beta-xylanase
MLWSVPGFGRVLVAADNQGRGYLPPHDGVLKIELVPEFARSRVSHVRRWIAQHHGGSGASSEAIRDLNAASSLLDIGQRSSDPRERSRSALEALRLGMLAGESEVLAEARETIRTRRRGTLHVTVADPQGRPLSGVKVHINQTTFDFLFGAYSDRYDANIITRMRSLGLNYAMLLMTWAQTEPMPGVFSLDDFDRRFTPAALRSNGFTLCEHGMVWLANGEMPSYMDRLKGNPDAVVAAINRHEQPLLSHYRDQVQIWESLNEGHPQWSRWDLDDEGILRVIKASTNNIRKQLPAAPIMVDVALPMGEDVALKHYPLIGAVSLGRVGVDSAEGYRQIERLSKAGVAFDVIALQFFEGAWVNVAWGVQVPAIDLFRLACELDRFKRFGKPIQIGEIAVGSSHKTSTMASWWHSPADQLTQADYLEDVFTLAYGDLQVQGVNWWGFDDTYQFVVDGGLFDRKGRPKLAAQRLRRLLGDWRSEGVVTTGSDGVADFEGAGGFYEIGATVDNRLVRMKTHIVQGSVTNLVIIPVKR